ncbi:MAG: hypothetical protein LBV73_10455, partial [Paraburkholderia sp.]|nr:hypothetical protein [Paraburkholderia sp.]
DGEMHYARANERRLARVEGARSIIADACGVVHARSCLDCVLAARVFHVCASRREFVGNSKRIRNVRRSSFAHPEDFVSCVIDAAVAPDGPCLRSLAGFYRLHAGVEPACAAFERGEYPASMASTYDESLLDAGRRLLFSA